MQSYGAAGNMDRLYEEEISILEAADYDPDHAGACLLGKDVAILANEETYKKLIAILDDESQMSRLAINMVGPFHYDGTALTKIQQLLGLFRRGMKIRAETKMQTAF
jgi:predicted nucleotidyltransferase